jgi:hypothetical protein
MPLIKADCKQAPLMYPNRGICLDPTEVVSKPKNAHRRFLFSTIFSLQMPNGRLRMAVVTKISIA